MFTGNTDEWAVSMTRGYTGELIDFRPGMAGDGSLYTPGSFSPGGIAYTEEEIEAMKEKTKETISASEALGQLIGQAIASASSFKEMGEAAAKAAAQFLGAQVSESVGGFFGPILGGGIQFLVNSLFNNDDKMPIVDNAVNTRIINWDEASIKLGIVRDRAERSYSSQFRSEFASAARGA